MIMYYSGSCGSVAGGGRIAEPEHILGDKATLMLSFYLIREGMQEQDKRFNEILIEREKRAKQCRE
jgi:hypothetical protein